MLEVISWLVVLAGLMAAARIAVGVLQTGRVTTDSLCSSAGTFVVLLIGSLLHSIARERDQR